jgi:hypothetical protein
VLADIPQKGFGTARHDSKPRKIKQNTGFLSFFDETGNFLL